MPSRCDRCHSEHRERRLSWRSAVPVSQTLRQRGPPSDPFFEGRLRWDETRARSLRHCAVAAGTGAVRSALPRTGRADPCAGMFLCGFRRFTDL